MSEIIEMPYGNGKALEREFIKKYEEVQLDVEMKRKQCRKACFVNYHYSGRCEDCLFVNTKDCPEYKEVEDNDSIL